MKNSTLGPLQMLAGVTLILLAASAPQDRAQATPTAAFTTVQSFTQVLDGVQPVSPLVLGADGNYYGVSTHGGRADDGVVFQVTPTGTTTIFFDFANDDTGGFHPMAGLCIAGDGNFYGTTSQGGDNGDGTLFQLTPTGVEATVHSFVSNPEGSSPVGTLVRGATSGLFGVCSSGGSSSAGTVYELTTGGGLTVLHSFGGFVGNNNANDGKFPNSSLCLGSDGNFYGVTEHGGALTYGTVFSITSTGTYTLLHSFDFTTGGFPDGALVELSASPGTFMGVTGIGGANGGGVAYQISSTMQFADVFDFTPVTDAIGGPFGQLTRGSEGLYYGFGRVGGPNSSGGIFAISPLGGVISTRASFGESEGQTPLETTAGLTAANGGNLFYGVTELSGLHDQGSVFTLANEGGAFTVLHDFFQGGNAGSRAGLVRDSLGVLYGTTTAGGASNLGTVFSLTPGGVFNTLHNFAGPDASTPEGATPSNGPLVLTSDGNLFGTTSAGGTNNLGTAYKLDNLNLTTLHSFGNLNSQGILADGSGPQAGLTLSNGNFFGVTNSGGENSDGTFFQLTPADVFTSVQSLLPAEGSSANDSLVLGGDGNFYGTAFGGGANGNGSIFSLSPSGAEKLVYSFSVTDSNGHNSDGSVPSASLLEGANRLFYGTAQGGGANGDGTIFTVTPEGVFNTLYSFSALPNGINADGAAPQGMVKGSDGNFYGCTVVGGANRNGTLFVVTPGGKLTTLHSFAAVSSGVNAEGAGPVAPLIEATTGVFYGTAQRGGTGGVGTIFSITVSPAITSALAAGGAVGQAFSYQITATNGPTSFAADSLPSFLTLNTTTGVISGTPTAAGNFLFKIGAQNAGGFDDEFFVLNAVAPTAPQITSALTASATVGQPFTYTITATGSSLSFAADSLPAGLSINTTTGVISGTLTTAGTFTFKIGAQNAGGFDDETVTLTVTPPPPQITSGGVATAVIGQPFSYQITATNAPTAFGAGDLPPGLDVDAVGLISGTPTMLGHFDVTLFVQNAGGDDISVITLNVIAPQQPTVALTSPPANLIVFAGADVPLAASVSDPAGILIQVQFFVGTTLIGTATTSPYSADFTAPGAGTYTLSAVATDSFGRQATSSRTLMTLTSAFSEPSVNLLSGGADGNSLAASSMLTLDYSVTTSDPSAPLVEVDFYADGTLYASLDASGNPITSSASKSGSPTRKDATAGANDFRVTFVLPGADEFVNLIAVAIDKLGRSQVSKTITVHAVVVAPNQEPAVSVGLTDGAFLKVNQPITVPVTATVPAAAGTSAQPHVLDAASNIAKVDYFLNGALQKEDTQPPFGFSFTPTTTGRYVVTAVATTSTGLSALSPPVRLQAVPPPNVSVAAKGDADAVEGETVGKIVVSRDSFLTENLTVAYKIKGTAKNGSDYKKLTGSVVIPTGATSAKIKIKPIDDMIMEGARSVTLKLRTSPTGNYEVSGPKKATVSILDKD